MANSDSEDGEIKREPVDRIGDQKNRRINLDDRSGPSPLNDSHKMRSHVNKIEYRSKHDKAEPSIGSSALNKKTMAEESLTTRTGGAYIPPARLRLMQDAITDKSSTEYQRLAWEALKKSLNGHINKVNVSNLRIIVVELLKENMIRGRGLFARAVIQAQAASPTFTHVYAALVAVVNSKFPQIGELILKRLVVQFRRSYRRNDKPVCLATSRFLAHLVNQEVAHEVVALELVTLLLENCTNDSVEIAVGFLKECGAKLTELTPRGIHAIFERLRAILQEGELDKRVQYMIEVIMAIRKDKFKDHPARPSELDLVDENDQFTHMIGLDDELDTDDKLNVFRHDHEYAINEEKYKTIRAQILGESDEDEESGSDCGDESDENDDQDGDKATDTAALVDATETDLVTLRRKIYLVIQSSLDFEECTHKLLKLGVESASQVTELCHMIIDCCAQQRTYIKFYGLVAQRFCLIDPAKYSEPFSEIFRGCYDTIHRFETVKLRNVAKLFAHLFFTDAISWSVLSHIHLNEDETTSSSRVFIKILFQELAEYMGMNKLNERIRDGTLSDAFAGLFPRDNPRNTRFAINFFTSIGLGAVTDELRDHLKVMPKIDPSMNMLKTALENNKDNDSSSDSSSSTESSSSESSSSSDGRSDRRNKQHKSISAKRKRLDNTLPDSGWGLPAVSDKKHEPLVDARHKRKDRDFKKTSPNKYNDRKDNIRHSRRDRSSSASSQSRSRSRSCSSNSRQVNDRRRHQQSPRRESRRSIPEKSKQQKAKKVESVSRRYSSSDDEDDARLRRRLLNKHPVSDSDGSSVAPSRSPLSSPDRSRATRSDKRSRVNHSPSTSPDRAKVRRNDKNRKPSRTPSTSPDRAKVTRDSTPSRRRSISPPKRYRECDSDSEYRRRREGRSRDKDSRTTTRAEKENVPSKENTPRSSSPRSRSHRKRRQEERNERY